ncbi:MAG: PHP domain-containing protein [Salinivirgaceae bacterium]|nr:PHP domain-containing protein [Salinivirgaceae bacterium]
MFQTYRADLHIHTLLSPCGDLEMSPFGIVDEACKKGLDIIGITDHNTTRQAPLIQKLGHERGLYVLCGAEVTTKEEAHCLAFMPSAESLETFQQYLDEHLPDIPNSEGEFGYQVCVDREEQIVFQEERLLISALDQSIEQMEQMVHSLGGIFIPAHINRPRYSIISQLGFVPLELNVEALELSKHVSIADFKAANKYLNNYSFIQSSDAHFLKDIGTVVTMLKMHHRSFDGIRSALRNIDKECR